MRYFPNLFCALFALFGFGACGSENGQDLFTQKFGSGTIARGGAGGSIGSGPSGGVTFVTGGSSSGGTPGSGGAFALGGALSTGGAGASGAGSDGLGAGGRTAGAPGTGGRTASGGSSNGANCSALRTELSVLLTQAQACTSSGSAAPCTGSVLDECGCMVPVNSETSVAAQAYRNQLQMIVAACPKPGCPDLACPDVTSASCKSSGNDEALGYCE